MDKCYPTRDKVRDFNRMKTENNLRCDLTGQLL